MSGESPRICAGVCGDALVRHPHESTENFVKRRTCGEPECVRAARNASNARPKKLAEDTGWPVRWPADLWFEDHPRAR